MNRPVRIARCVWRVVSVACGVIIGAWLWYSAADREVPVTVTEMRPERSAVKAGDTFRAEYRFVRHRACHTHVDRFFFTSDNVRYVVPPLDFPIGALPPGKDRARVPAVVPGTASKGPAIYRTVNCYRCNWTHRLWPVCALPRDIHFLIE